MRSLNTPPARPLFIGPGGTPHLSGTKPHAWPDLQLRFSLDVLAKDPLSLRLVSHRPKEDLDLGPTERDVTDSLAASFFLLQGSARMLPQTTSCSRPRQGKRGITISTVSNELRTGKKGGRAG